MDKEHKSNIVLYSDKSECCGCGACMNVCPTHAITMEEDEYGFTYPVIDNTLCIECGACKTVCGYQNLPEMHEPIKSYAAAAKDDELLKKSASGGVFAILANNVLNEGGVVYGAALPYENGKLVPKHIRIENIEELIKLQGSKYTQSDTGVTFQNAKEDLLEGRKVLYSGTPCQIAGLKKYLKKEYDNLLAVEIICHGVPSAKFFQDYISNEERKRGISISGFLFRDKSRGQGMTRRIEYINPSTKKTEKLVANGKKESYISFFSKSYTYRINCYTCPYACKERIADLTIGDFWGFHEEYPDVKSSSGLTNGKGVSCVLANTAKGQDTMENCAKELALMDAEFDKISRHNAQLHEPSKYNKIREEILEIYREQGYAAVEKFYAKKFRKERIKYTIVDLLPKGIRRRVKIIAGKLKQR